MQMKIKYYISLKEERNNISREVGGKTLISVTEYVCFINVSAYVGDNMSFVQLPSITPNTTTNINTYNNHVTALEVPRVFPGQVMQSGKTPGPTYHDTTYNDRRFIILVFNPPLGLRNSHHFPKCPVCSEILVGSFTESGENNCRKSGILQLQFLENRGILGKFA